MLTALDRESWAATRADLLYAMGALVFDESSLGGRCQIRHGMRSRAHAHSHGLASSLSALNEESLKIIESSILVLCLDDCEPMTLSKSSANFLHG